MVSRQRKLQRDIEDAKRKVLHRRLKIAALGVWDLIFVTGIVMVALFVPGATHGADPRSGSIVAIVFGLVISNGLALYLLSNDFDGKFATQALRKARRAYEDYQDEQIELQEKQRQRELADAERLIKDFQPRIPKEN